MMNTWAVYISPPELLVDVTDEGNCPTGAIGSNWQPGYSREEAEALLEQYLAEGYERGHTHAPRF